MLPPLFPHPTSNIKHVSFISRSTEDMATSHHSIASQIKQSLKKSQQLEVKHLKP